MTRNRGARFAAAVVALALGAAACVDDEPASPADRAGRSTSVAPATTGGPTTSDEGPSTTPTPPSDSPTSAPTPTTGSDGDRPRPTSTVTTTPPTDSGGPPRGPRLAHPSGLTADPHCEDGRAVVDLAWVPATGDRPQRVEVTIRRDGFEGGEVDAGPELGPDASGLRWDRLEGQAVHYWRVVAGEGAARVVSEVATFEGPSCPVDMQ